MTELKRVVDRHKYLWKRKRSIYIGLGIMVLLGSCTWYFTLKRRGNFKVQEIFNELYGGTFLSGDVIFQMTFGELSNIIREMTQSKYTHCGIVLVEGK